MRYEFKLPDLAEGMVEGEIVSWLVDIGQDVKDEQPVVEVMTDKATVVIQSPRSGKMLEECFGAGDIAPVGTTLFVLEVEGEGAAVPAEAPVTPEVAPEPAPVRPAPATREAAPPTSRSGPAPVPRGPGKALATPATRRLARELGVSIDAVVGTGPGGRVTKQDVEASARGGDEGASPVAPVAPAPSPAVRPVLAPAGQEHEERVPIRGLRRAIHEVMSRSTSTAAHFTYVEEVDCTNLVAARARLKPAAETAGVRLTYLPFMAKAVMLAIRAFPKMNASVDDAAGEVVLKGHVHLGIAAATEGGLMVPVLRHAEHLTLLDLAAGIVDLGTRARQGGLRPEEAKGSTITITSLGKLGGVLATPIINHPEVAILGIHKISDSAVVRSGEIVIRPMMNLSLSFDHRVIDGHEGAAFAQQIRAYLEDPELMMLEMV